MCRTLEFMAIAAILLTPLCHGQSMQDMVSYKNAQVGGIRLYNVSTFGGYSTSAAQPGTVAGVGSNLLGPDFNYGAAVAAGGQHRGQRTNSSFMYSGTYMGMARYTELNSYNQAGSVDFNRILTQKWSLGLSGAAQDTNLAQFMYQPSNLSVISNLQTSFDDLAAAFSVGRFSNAQAATMLTGSPILDTPTRNLLLGNRVLSASAQASLTYTHSSRLSLRFGSSATAAKHLNEIQTGLLQSSKGINGVMAVTYALSPRTDMGASVDVARIHNALQIASTYSSSVYWGRKMGPHWFLRLSGGGAHTRTEASSVYSSTAVQVIGGASIGFQTLKHTFVVSANRSATDPFGIVAAEIMIAGASWSWRPGRSWAISSGLTHQRWASPVYQNVTGWQGHAGVSRPLGSGLTLSMEYSYLFGTSLYLGTIGDRNIHGVRMSLSWSPMSGRR